MIQAAGAAFMMGFVAVLAAASALVMMKFMLMFMAAAACAVIVVMIWMDMRIFVGAAGFGNLFRMFPSTAVGAFVFVVSHCPFLLSCAGYAPAPLK